MGMTASRSEHAETAAGAMLAAALAYAEAGLHVFPLKPRSKVPATLDGLKSATTDAEQLRAWWERWPEANVAILAGAESRVVVLDVDAQHGGAGSLRELERRHGELPKTARVLTGGGGQHVYFRHPGPEVRNSAGRLGSGLDVRGDGGYVVAPPSVHENGRAYHWMRPLRRGIANVPGWLLEDAEKRRNGGPVEPVDELIPEGQRREAMLSLAGTLRRRGLGASEILAALEAVNAARCRPPLRPRELEALAHDVAGRWEPDTASVLARQADEPDNRMNGANASSHAALGCPATDRTAPGQPPELAVEPQILDVFAADLRRRGVAGEERLGKLIYLALTSRLLPWGRSTNRPVSLLIRGTTSTGKSWALSVVAEFFPEGAVVDLGSMSRRFLFYDEESYAHRVLLIPEAAQVIDDDELLALLRTLLSEGRVVHGTVVGEGKPTARRIVKEGPTALVTSTTRVHLDDELETRMLAVRTDDTPEQTRRVFEIHAGLEQVSSDDFDFERWHDLQLWLAQAENRVVVPFIGALAKLMPAGATRLRRDFVSMLCLVRASALLHQQTRERDAAGRVVAAIADYRTIRDLIGDVIAESVDAGVSPAIRETVETARTLLDDGREHVTPRQLEQELGVGRSATYDRIRRALQGGWLANTADKDERGMRVVIGTPLPGDDEYLPTVDEVVRLMSGGHPDAAKAHG
jgi:hypothetical protein